MAKKKLIYNLGRRGFFSEINNMVIAKIFAEELGWDFEVNSTYWNCRYHKGLEDYFKPYINERNNIFSAQMVRNTSFSLSLHTLFYIIISILNKTYHLFHRNVIWGADVYNSFRETSYLRQINEKKFLLELQAVLHLNDTLQNEFQEKLSHMNLDAPFLGIHVRRGDKIATGEMEDISLSCYIDAIKETSFKQVYVATDDYKCIEYIKKHLLPLGYKIYYNPELSGSGFNESGFNHSSKVARYKETCTLLFDIFMLFHASYFIGTYSSNLSRVIPCALGLENCKSLDKDWFIG